LKTETKTKDLNEGKTENKRQYLKTNN